MDEGARLPTRARLPEVAILLVAGLLLVVASPQVYAQYWSPRAALSLVVIAPGLVALTLAAWARDRAAIAGLVFVGIAGISAIVSPAPGLALLGMYNHGTGWLFVAVVIGMWALGRRWSAVSARALGSVILGGAFVNAVMVWLQVSRNFHGDLFTMVDGRPPALFGNPVHASALFLGAFAIVAERWRTDARGREASVIYLGLAVLLASALELAGGRIGLAVLAVVLIAFAARARARVIPLAIAVVLGVGGAILIAPDDAGASSRVTAGGESAFSGRIERWKLGAAAFTERPILGEGPGLYRRATTRHNTAAAARAFGSDRLNIDAHNVFVEYLVTTGALGVLALMWWLIAAARGARGELAWFAGVGAISLLLQPLFIGLTPVLALALGAAKRGPPVRIPSALKVVTAGVVIAGLGFGGLLLRGDVLQRRTAVDLNPADGRAAVRALPVWPEPAVKEAQAYKHAAVSRRSRRSGRAAVAAQREAHRRDPSDTGVSLVLGNLELTYGTRAASRAAFADALAWDPYSAQALVALAGFAAADGHPQERARLCARARSVAPEARCRFRVPLR